MNNYVKICNELQKCSLKVSLNESLKDGEKRRQNPENRGKGKQLGLQSQLCT